MKRKKQKGKTETRCNIKSAGKAEENGDGGEVEQEHLSLSIANQ